MKFSIRIYFILFHVLPTNSPSPCVCNERKISGHDQDVISALYYTYLHLVHVKNTVCPSSADLNCNVA